MVNPPWPIKRQENKNWPITTQATASSISPDWNRSLLWVDEFPEWKETLHKSIPVFWKIFHCLENTSLSINKTSWTHHITHINNELIICKSCWLTIANCQTTDKVLAWSFEIEILNKEIHWKKIEVIQFWRLATSLDKILLLKVYFANKASWQGLMHNESTKIEW